MSTTITVGPQSVEPAPTTPSTSESSKPNARQLLLDALKKSWTNYLAQLERCRTEFSEDAVHDLRVATRRLMAIIQLLHSIEACRRLKKIIRALKKQLDEFDQLRDTQVILAEISRAVGEQSELRDFQENQHLAEEQLLQTLGKKVAEFDISKLSERVCKTQKALEDSAEGALESEILQAVDDAYVRTRQRLAQVDLSQPRTIHRERIAFKTFRYMVEIIFPLLKDFPQTNLKWMNEYQTLMGNVQDAEVFSQRLSEYFTHASLSDLGSVRRYPEHRHAEAISDYAEHMNQLNLFWRPAPDMRFPWETGD
jgi:CHAD domain-containing protein